MRQALKIPQATEIPKRHNFNIAWDRFCLNLDLKTHLMGVLNRTPDSFSDGGQFMDEGRAIDHAMQMIEAGADILDIGGESTRPGSSCVGENEEIKRVIPLIHKLAKKIKVPISIDTQKASVAEAALNEGAGIVNDISGLMADSRMGRVIASYKVPVIVMHMKGTPRTMQLDPNYSDVLLEIIASLRKSIRAAIAAGVPEDKIIIDPGIGFGKTTEHNLEVLGRLNQLKILNRPILVGPSRKSFIGNVLGSNVEDRLIGTCVACAVAALNGANILRVHDIKEMSQVAQFVDAVTKSIKPH